MKKLVIVLLLALPVLAWSQEFNAGILLGAVPSQLDRDTFSGYHKFGYTGGAYINRFFTKNSGWQFGMRFIEKGSRESDNQNGVYYRCVLRYVEMPVTYLFNFKKHFRFEAGITTGYLIQALEAKGDDFLEEAYPEFRKFEFAAVVGLNYRFNDKIGAVLQYERSFINVRPFSENNSAYMEEEGQVNNILVIGLTYTFKSWH